MLEINKTYLGDCLELMKDIDDKSIDLILCDLPYQATSRNKWDIIIPFDKLWKQYERIIKPKGNIVLFGQGKFTAQLICSNLPLYRYSLVWQKTTPTGHLNAKRQPMRIHEDIVVMAKKLGTYNPQKTTGHVRKVSSAHHKRNSKETTNYGKHNLSSYDSTERYPTSILTFATDKQKSALHPTQKPLALCEYLVNTYSNEGDLVLDNCAGSGTTGLAAKNLSRNYIMMEKEEKYFDIIQERIK